ncbi:hypothetical protein EYC84_010483 [Monilinia fructicola]|uniref:Uncharacterized protein n=1 Tax=Monilinia fructicola TaxID=38448 RepID=A0A5M9JHN5_MONFR|nr:hypothetical protein EYC84_010483 [Monilinia fructicola]
MAIQETKKTICQTNEMLPECSQTKSRQTNPPTPYHSTKSPQIPQTSFLPPPHARPPPQSIPRTCPTSTNLNLGSLAVRSRVTKSTAPSASAASRAIRIRLDTRRAADLPASLLNGITNPQTLTTQDDGMAIDSSSSSNPAAQSQGTTTDAATTDADAATTDVAMTDVTMTDVAMTDVVMTDVVMTDVVLMTDVLMTDAAGK